MPTRHGGEATLAFWSAASGAGHSRRGAGCVEAYQLRDVKSGLAFLPLGSCGLHVVALLLAGVQGFFSVMQGRGPLGTAATARPTARIRPWKPAVRGHDRSVDV